MEQPERMKRKGQLIQGLGQEMQRLGRSMALKNINNQETALDEFLATMLKMAEEGVELKKPQGGV